jgi:hypothetical protein
VHSAACRRSVEGAAGERAEADIKQEAKEHQMTKVFLLWHSRPIEGGIDEHDTNDKLVGVYSSRAEADAARCRKLQFPGFRDYPDCFSVSEVTVDRDNWSEGFFIVR